MLTSAEQKSIQNLIELGFMKNNVIEAFLCCEKDEEKTFKLFSEIKKPIVSDPEYDMIEPDFREE